MAGMGFDAAQATGGQSTTRTYNAHYLSSSDINHGRIVGLHCADIAVRDNAYVLKHSVNEFKDHQKDSNLPLFFLKGLKYRPAHIQ